jgi:transcriptional regulator with XRE-family HTH domain
VKGEELKSIRKKLGWTQVQMAKAIGVDPNTVARWERNEVGISEPIARFIRTVAKTKKKAR